MTTIEGNKIIAEFEGSMIIRDYHKDWNHLMRVVDKIEENYKTVIATSDWGKKHYMNIVTRVGVVKETLDNPSKFMGQGDTKREAVYLAVIQFIQWYQKQTK